jgi:hypothetical protein
VTRKDRPPGGETGGPEDTSPPQCESAVIVPPGDDPGPVTGDWLRRHGYVLAADERARQSRMARGALDRLAYGEPRRGRWQCPGEFGPDGTFRKHCGRVA